MIEEKRYAKKYLSNTQEYMTPQPLYQLILDFMCIDEFTSDIACSNMNIPAKYYYTKDGKFSKSDFFFKLSDDTGLNGNFGEGVHFCNPPFRETRHFLKTIASEIKKEPKSKFWCILPVDRFETKYYWDYILKNPNCFFVPLQKQGFLVPSNPLDKPVPSVKVMYAYFGTDAQETAESFHEIYGEYPVVYNKLYLN